MHGKVLDISSDDIASGIPVIMLPKKKYPTDTQLWYIDPESNFLRSNYKDLVLESQGRRIFKRLCGKKIITNNF